MLNNIYLLLFYSNNWYVMICVVMIHPEQACNLF
jgi:hypothetical protein